MSARVLSRRVGHLFTGSQVKVGKNHDKYNPDLLENCSPCSLLTLVFSCKLDFVLVSLALVSFLFFSHRPALDVLSVCDAGKREVLTMLMTSSKVVENSRISDHVTKLDES